MDNNTLKQFKTEFENELQNNILKFWNEKSIDYQNMGFYGIGGEPSMRFKDGRLWGECAII